VMRLKELMSAYRAAQANDAKPEPDTGAQTVPGYKRRKSATKSA
jgi:hypothetical protein